MAATTVAETRIVFSGEATEAQRAAKQAADALKVVEDAAKKSAGVFTNDLAPGGKKAEEALKLLQAAGQPASQALEGLGVNMGFVGKALAALTSPVALVAEGLGLIGTAATLGINAMVSFGGEVKRVMNVSDLSAQQSAQLVGAFRLLGKDTEALEKAMFKMAQEVDSGGINLRRLGVSIRDESGNLKSAGAIFLEARDKIAGLGSALERNVANKELFSRAGRELISILGMEQEKWDALMKLSSEKMPWSEEQQAATKKYKLAVNELDLAWEALKVSMGTPVIGVVTIVTKAAANLFSVPKIDATQLEDLRQKGLIGYGEYLERRAALDAKAASERQRALAKEQAAEMNIGGAPAELTDIDRKARVLDIDSKKQERLNALTVEAAAMHQSLDFDLSILAKKHAAEREALQKKIGLIETGVTKDDQAYGKTGTLHKALTDQLAKGDADYQAARIGLLNKGFLATVADQNALATLNKTTLAQQTKDTERFTREVQALNQTDAENFKDKALQEYTDYANSFGDMEDATAAALKLQEQAWSVYTEKVKHYNADATQKALDVLGAWSQHVETILGGQTGAVEKEYQRQLGIVETNYAVQKSLAGDNAAALLKADADYFTAKAKLAADFGERSKQAAVKDLEDEIARRSTATDAMKRYLDDEGHKALEVRARDIAGDQAVLQRRLNSLALIAEKDRTNAILHGEITARLQQTDGRYFDFLGTQLKLTALRSGDLWSDMQRASDNLFTGLTNLTVNWVDQWRKGTFDVKKAMTDLADVVIQEGERMAAQTAWRAIFNAAGTAISGSGSGKTDQSGAGIFDSVTSSSDSGSILDSIGSFVKGLFDFGANGMLVTGGRPGVDSVPIMAQQGERVLSVPQTKALDAMGFQFMAGGGVVAPWRPGITLPFFGNIGGNLGMLGSHGVSATTQLMESMGLPQSPGFFKSLFKGDWGGMFAGGVGSIIDLLVSHFGGTLAGLANSSIIPSVLDWFTARRLNAEWRGDPMHPMNWADPSMGVARAGALSSPSSTRDFLDSVRASLVPSGGFGMDAYNPYTPGAAFSYGRADTRGWEYTLPSGGAFEGGRVLGGGPINPWLGGGGNLTGGASGTYSPGGWTESGAGSGGYGVTPLQPAVASGLAQAFPGLPLDSGRGALDWGGYMAEGGIVRRPTHAIIGEAGAEVVAPLKGLTEGLAAAVSQAVAQAMTASRGGWEGGGQPLVVQVVLPNGDVLTETVIRGIDVRVRSGQTFTWGDAIKSKRRS